MGNRASWNGVLSKPALERWRSPVADCIVTDPARLAWILKTYPESDQVRPGILHRDARGTKIRKTDADIEPVLEDCRESWRVSLGGFEGDEGALVDAADEEIELAVAAD